MRCIAIYCIALHASINKSGRPNQEPPGGSQKQHAAQCVQLAHCPQQGVTLLDAARQQARIPRTLCRTLCSLCAAPEGVTLLDGTRLSGSCRHLQGALLFSSSHMHVGEWQ
jgi:hypothetical protein